MAHFARVVDGIVEEIHVVANAVITDHDGVEQESLGAEFLAALHGYDPERVIQCSYNGTIRGSYPAVGWVYDADIDEFVNPLLSDVADTSEA